MFTIVREARGTRVSTRVATRAAMMALLFTLAACSGGDGGTTTPTPAAVASLTGFLTKDVAALAALRKELGLDIYNMREKLAAKGLVYEDYAGE